VEIPVYFKEKPIYLFANVSDKDGHLISSIPQQVIPLKYGIKEVLSLPEKTIIADKDPNFGNASSFKATKLYAWVQDKESKAVCEYDIKEKFSGKKVLKVQCVNNKTLKLTREHHHYALRALGRNNYTFKIRLKSDKMGQNIYLGLYNNKTRKTFSKPVKLSTVWKEYKVNLNIPDNETESLLARIYIPAKEADSNIWLSGYSLELK